MLSGRGRCRTVRGRCFLPRELSRFRSRRTSALSAQGSMRVYLYISPSRSQSRSNRREASQPSAVSPSPDGLRQLTSPDPGSHTTPTPTPPSIGIGSSNTHQDDDDDCVDALLIQPIQPPQFPTCAFPILHLAGVRFCLFCNRK